MPGTFRLGLALGMTGMHMEHDVLSVQREPGLSAARQPSRHIVDALVMFAQVDAQIAIHERFAVEASLPVRANRLRAAFENADGEPIADLVSIHHRDETVAGLGDLTLGTRIGLVRPIDVTRWNLDLRVGFTQPTGRIEPDPFDLTVEGIDHQHVFFGNGTFDPRFGLDTRVQLDKWSLVAWADARVPVSRNVYGYLGSRTVATGVGAVSSFGLDRWSFLVQPELYWESAATWRELPARNSGRLSLLATAGVFVAPAENMQLGASVSVPYFTRAINGDLRWPLVGILSASFTFGLAEDDDDHDHDHGDEHEHGDAHDHGAEDEHDHGGEHDPADADEHDHAAGDEHDHDGEHDHHGESA